MSENITASVTRSQSTVFLVGEPIAEICGRKLPSIGDVIRRFFFIHRIDNRTIKEAAASVCRELQIFWQKARIPAKDKQHIISKVENLFSEWRKLLKGKCRRSQPQIMKESLFVAELDNLFDIAHADAMNLIRIDEDKLFLEAQRENGRRGFMAGEDTVLAGVEERRLNRDVARKKAVERETEKLISTASYISSDSESTDVDDTATNESDFEPSSSTCATRHSTKRCRRASVNVVTPQLAAALDRTRTTNRNAVYLLSEAASSLGSQPSDLAINRETIRRMRIKWRTEAAKYIKESFSANGPLIVHWDSKLMPDLIGSETVDRLAIIVSGENTSKLLKVPKLQSGTGFETSQAVYDCLQEWNISNQIQGFSFDTTASNTGKTNGACQLLQQKLGRNILQFACRHHVLEIVADKTFKECLNVPSCSPDILLFKRFKEHWHKIEQHLFQPIHQEDGTIPVCCDEIINFCIQQLELKHPRDDYRELIELTIISLGGIPKRGVRFMAPGACHRARWMGKIIYSLKIYLFRQQFKLTKTELNGLHRFVLFAISTYVPAWVTAPNAVAAPGNDLKFLKKIVTYADRGISKAATAAFLNHLWYISEELVGLAFFDPNVSTATKIEMIDAMKRPVNGNKRGSANLADVDRLTLSDFVTQSTKHLIDSLMLPNEYLSISPAEWKDRPDYQAAEHRARELRVVNDFAERGIALIQDYNTAITTDEAQKQYLLQTVERHRKMFPDSRKSTVTAAQ